jgi:hypothetical protein
MQFQFCRRRRDRKEAVMQASIPIRDAGSVREAVDRPLRTDNPSPAVDDDVRVRVLVDLPDYGLTRGQTAVLCSTWHCSAMSGAGEVYEVEFFCLITGEIRRAMLQAEHVEVVDEEPAGC